MDRPSQHGKILGQALALLAMAGRRDAPLEIPESCATCAFREGSMPNMSAGTGQAALDCALGIDKDRFACHHGMKEGEPSKLCVGYIAATLATWSFTKQVIETLYKDLGDQPGSDEVRAAFDAWLATVDPKGEKDVYQLASEFNRERPACPSST